MHGAVAGAHVDAAYRMADGLFHARKRVLDGLDVREGVHGDVHCDHDEVAATVAACAQLAHVFVLTGEIAVIEVKCAEVSAGVVKRFCYESQIHAGAGGEIASVDLLVKEKLIFAILLYIIERLVGFRIALFKGIALGAHAQSGREGSAVHLYIVRCELTESGKELTHLPGNLIPADLRYKEQKFVSAQAAGNGGLVIICKQSAEQLQCAVSGFVSVEVIDLFQVVHIDENKIAAVLLHEFCRESFT